jgi:hypothetical protein
MFKRATAIPFSGKMRKLLFKTILWMLGLLALSIALSGAQTKGGAKAGKQNKVARPARSAPASPARDVAPYTGDEARKNAEQSLQQQKDTLEATKALAEDTRRIANHTLWLVVIGLGVGIGQALIVFFQLRSTERAAKAAESAMKIAERATLLVSGVGDEPAESVDGSGAYVTVDFKNFGKTQATDIQINIALVIPGNLEIFPKDSGPSVLGSGQVATVEFPPLAECLSEDELHGIPDGSTQLRFEGTIDYEDAFGHPHRTKAAGAYVPSTKTWRIDMNDPD